MKHLLFTLLLLTACSLFALEVDWSKAKPVQTGALLLKFELSDFPNRGWRRSTSCGSILGRRG